MATRVSLMLMVGLVLLLAAPVVAQGDPTTAPGTPEAPAASGPVPVEGEASGGPTAEPTAAPSPAADAAYDPFAVIPVAGDDGEEGPLEKAARDPVGNGISIVVLVLLGVSLIAAPLLAVRGSLPHFPGWLTIVLVLVGMAVALYLANVETSGSEAVCGPVGDCNAVQDSEYSSIFGIHIGVLGVLGYGAIGTLWVVSRVARGAVADWSLVLIALGTIVGVGFSAYLTFLEPFVIGATCLWCITSALVMLALLWVSVGPGYAAWRRIRGGSGDPGTAAA